MIHFSREIRTENDFPEIPVCGRKNPALAGCRAGGQNQLSSRHTKYEDQLVQTNVNAAIVELLKMRQTLGTRHRTRNPGFSPPPPSRLGSRL